MPFVMNASSKEHVVKVHGRYFTFKSGQIKNMEPNKVFHLITKCNHLGFVSLSDKFEDPQYQISDAGKAELAEAKARGVAARVAYLESMKKNEFESLRKDMDAANIKSNISSQMSPDTLKTLDEAAAELKTYAEAKKGAQKQTEDKLKAIEAEFEKAV